MLDYYDLQLLIILYFFTYYSLLWERNAEKTTEQRK